MKSITSLGGSVGTRSHFSHAQLSISAGTTITCNKVYGRHSKSIDVSKQGKMFPLVFDDSLTTLAGCGVCHGKLELLPRV